MKRIISILTLVALFSACKKTELPVQTEKEVASVASSEPRNINSLKIYTITPKDLSVHEAVSGGNIFAGANSLVDKGVCASISPNPTINDLKFSSGSGPDNFTTQLTGLSAGTTYYIRAYYTAISNKTTYGDEKSFTTATSNSFQIVSRWNGTSSLYVSDPQGLYMANIYTNITSTPDYPSWSIDGQKICFVQGQTDLYTLDYTIVNDMPMGLYPIKIADGVAAGGKYRKAAFRPNTSSLAAAFQSTSGATSIRIIPVSGGSYSTLYTSPSDFTLDHPLASRHISHVTFNSDGSLLAFFERKISTNQNFLRIFDMTANTIVKSIELSQFWGITDIDWANTPGSNLIGFSAEPDICGGMGNMHKLYTIDVSSATPIPSFVKNDVDDFSWAPNDQDVVCSRFNLSILNPNNGCEIRYYENGIIKLTLSTNTELSTYYSKGYNPDWKR